MTEWHYRCPLERMSDHRDVEQIKCAGWRAEAILVVSANDVRLNWMEKQVVEQIGNRIYGRRKTK